MLESEYTRVGLVYKNIHYVDLKLLIKILIVGCFFIRIPKVMNF